MLGFRGCREFPSSDLYVYQAKSLQTSEVSAALVHCAWQRVVLCCLPSPSWFRWSRRNRRSMAGTPGINLVGANTSRWPFGGGWMCWDREVCVLFLFFPCGGGGGNPKFQRWRTKRGKIVRETQVFDSCLIFEEWFACNISFNFWAC